MDYIKGVKYIYLKTFISRPLQQMLGMLNNVTSYTLLLSNLVKGVIL